MIYIRNQNEVYYLVSEPVGPVFCQLFNFTTMNVTERAVIARTSWLFEALELNQNDILPNDSFKLTLDFAANARIPLYTNVINYLTAFLESLGYNAIIDEVPLTLVVDNLSMGQILSLIQNDTFQTINNAVSNLNSSTWRVSKN